MSAVPAAGAGSLWDRAPGFVSLRNLMERLRTAGIACLFSNLAVAAELSRDAPAGERVSAEVAAAWERDIFAYAETLCSVAGLRHSETALARLRLDFPAGIRHGAAGQALTHFSDLLMSELEDCHLFLVPKGRVSYYGSTRLFGDAVRDAFPSALQDVAEAGSCYATGCYTACVFHCMRALESGLAALAEDVLGRRPGREQWGNIIEDVEKAVETVRKNGIPGVGRDEKNEKLQFWSEAAKEFGYFKDGWRNHVTHARTFYDENSALSVLHHVRAFMAVLATRLRE